jgi:hypothetical protein
MMWGAWGSGMLRAWLGGAGGGPALPPPLPGPPAAAAAAAAAWHGSQLPRPGSVLPPGACHDPAPASTPAHCMRERTAARQSFWAGQQVPPLPLQLGPSAFSPSVPPCPLPQRRKAFTISQLALSELKTCGHWRCGPSPGPCAVRPIGSCGARSMSNLAWLVNGENNVIVNRCGFDVGYRWSNRPRALSRSVRQPR